MAGKPKRVTSRKRPLAKPGSVRGDAVRGLVEDHEQDFEPFDSTSISNALWALEKKGVLDHRTATSCRFLVSKVAEGASEGIVRLAELQESGNMLSVIGNAISYGIRRAILADMLHMVDWNLSHAAEFLGFTDATALRREIQRHGLGGELEAARKRGAVRPGGGRIRVNPERIE